MQDSANTAYLDSSNHVNLPTFLRKVKAKGNVRTYLDPNELPNLINRLAQVYRQQREGLQQVSAALEEGVFQVTIHTRTTTVALPVPAQIGVDVASLLEGVFHDQIATTIGRLESAHAELAEHLREPSGEAMTEFQAEALYEQLLLTPVAPYAPKYPKPSHQVQGADTNRSRSQHRRDRRRGR